MAAGRGAWYERNHDWIETTQWQLAQSTTLNPAVRARAWLIDGKIGERIEFISDSPTEKPVTWMIVDEGLNVIGQYSHLPLSLSITNRQRFALIMLANTQLDATVTLPFHSVVYA